MCRKREMSVGERVGKDLKGGCGVEDVQRIFWGCADGLGLIEKEPSPRRVNVNAIGCACVSFDTHVVAPLKSKTVVFVSFAKTVVTSRKPWFWTTNREDVDVTFAPESIPRGKLRTGLPSVDQRVRLLGFVTCEMVQAMMGTAERALHRVGVI
jgi:hypothetical protein